MNKDRWHKAIVSIEDYENGNLYGKLTRQLNQYYEQNHKDELSSLKIFLENNHEENYTFYFPPFDSPIVRTIISDLNGVVTEKPEQDIIHVFWEP